MLDNWIYLNFWLQLFYAILTKYIIYLYYNPIIYPAFSKASIINIFAQNISHFQFKFKILICKLHVHFCTFNSSIGRLKTTIESRKKEKISTTIAGSRKIICKQTFSIFNDDNVFVDWIFCVVLWLLLLLLLRWYPLHAYRTYFFCIYIGNQISHNFHQWWLFGKMFARTTIYFLSIHSSAFIHVNWWNSVSEQATFLLIGWNILYLHCDPPDESAGKMLAINNNRKDGRHDARKKNSNNTI